MIPVDLSANCEGWIYDPNGSGIQILGIRSRDRFSGSTDMSGGRRGNSNRPASWRKYDVREVRVELSDCSSQDVQSDSLA